MSVRLRIKTIYIYVHMTVDFFSHLLTLNECSAYKICHDMICGAFENMILSLKWLCFILIPNANGKNILDRVYSVLCNLIDKRWRIHLVISAGTPLATHNRIMNDSPPFAYTHVLPQQNHMQPIDWTHYDTWMHNHTQNSRRITS